MLTSFPAALYEWVDVVVDGFDASLECSADVNAAISESVGARPLSCVIVAVISAFAVSGSV